MKNWFQGEDRRTHLGDQSLWTWGSIPLNLILTLTLTLHVKNKSLPSTTVCWWSRFISAKGHSNCGKPKALCHLQDPVQWLSWAMTEPKTFRGRSECSKIGWEKSPMWARNRGISLNWKIQVLKGKCSQMRKGYGCQLQSHVPGKKKWKLHYSGRNVLKGMLQEDLFCVSVTEMAWNQEDLQDILQIQLNIQTVITIHLGFVPLCNAQRILSEMWDNKKIMGNWNLLWKPQKHACIFSAVLSVQLQCIDS